MRMGQFLQATVVGLLAAAWTWASYRFGASNEPSDAATVLAVAPVLVAVVISLWGRLHWLGTVVVSALLGAVLVWAWPLMRTHVSWLYYLQHLGIHLILAAVFGRTLVGSGDALITQLARRVHREPLSALNVHYTRQVTRAWTLYFLGMAVVSSLLFAFGPLPVWSAFANLMTAPMVTLMFLGEYFCRVRVLPANERPGLMEAIRAWREHQTSIDEPSGHAR